jgi:type II secretory pathway pseudopilin PulG
VKSRGLYRHAEAGFSIVELVVVIGILGTLLSIGTISFTQWLVKHRVEAQVRQMVTDFSELRIKAFTRKQRHSITVNKLGYIFKSYSSDNENLTSGGTIIPPNVRPVNYPLKSDASTDYAGTVFEIDSRGMLLGTIGTIYLDYQNGSPFVDCLTIHYIRINQGKRNAAWSACDDK